MANQPRRAAQYIRMSTDRQDLSPLVQKDAIEAFARANGFEIVRSYEDQGKSGVQLANRPRLRQLLRDVAASAPFSDILVYDVSRWGRFQDSDAAAYYEYHCRLNGVQVVYVSEPFGNDQTPSTALLKSMKRVMAAEYSRDIAVKARAGQARVVGMGFHMGALPAFGYRRCSVSAGGARRLMLENGQRKAALTDRIEWVLGPDAEVELVRRICAAYATGYQPEEIASLVTAEGWRTQKGHALTAHGLREFLANEALIGNFAWGVKSKGGKVIQCTPTRMDGSVPRIVDDTTWGLMQARLKNDAAIQARRQAAAAPSHSVGPATRRPLQLRLALARVGGNRNYRQTLGSPRALRDHTREFGRALCTVLRDGGLPCGFDPRSNVLTFWSARIRVRLMWPVDPTTWTLGRGRNASEVTNVLVARMTGLHKPLDFFVLSANLAASAFSPPLHTDVPRHLRPYWCASAEDVIARLSAIAAQTSSPKRRITRQLREACSRTPPASRRATAGKPA